MLKTDKGHFWLTFENGYTVSVFNGFGSYTENHFKTELFCVPEYQSVDSKSCEVAIIYKDLGLVNPLGWEDDVKGFVTPKELLEILNKVSKLEGEK